MRGGRPHSSDRPLTGTARVVLVARSGALD